MDKLVQTIEKPKRSFIRLNEVISRTGCSRTYIYRKMKEGTFPKGLKLGGPLKDHYKFDNRAIGWIEDEVDQWIEDRIEERQEI